MLTLNEIIIILDVYIGGCILFFITSTLIRGFYSRPMTGIFMDTFLWFVDVIYTIGGLTGYIKSKLFTKKLDEPK